MFVLTTRAKLALTQDQLYGKELMPMITWVTDNAFRNGKWEFGGFIAKSDSRLEELKKCTDVQFFYEISGIEFIVDGPMHHLDLLKDSTLDYLNGKFMFRNGTKGGGV
ncbi:MAG: hypothetical protein ACU833_13395 [Gammaproteobacteria bacterium]